MGKVFLGTDQRDQSINIAIKVMNKRKITKEDMDDIKNEIRLMQQVDHPNIVKYYETYNDKKYVYLCMELCTGGEFFAKVVESDKPLTESEAGV